MARPHPFVFARTRCLQEVTFSKLPGVLKTRVGYTGGNAQNPTYGSVCSGDGHTEAMRVWFDSKQVSYEQLLQVGAVHGLLSGTTQHACICIRSMHASDCCQVAIVAPSRNGIHHTAARQKPYL